MSNGSGEHELLGDRETLRPGELGDPTVIEQRRLTEMLKDDPNPYVRLIAHMSQRQLDMHEMLIAVRDDINELKEQFKKQG